MSAITHDSTLTQFAVTLTKNVKHAHSTFSHQVSSLRDEQNSKDNISSGLPALNSSDSEQNIHSNSSSLAVLPTCKVIQTMTAEDLLHQSLFTCDKMEDPSLTGHFSSRPIQSRQTRQSRPLTNSNKKTHSLVEAIALSSWSPIEDILWLSWSNVTFSAVRLPSTPLDTEFQPFQLFHFPITSENVCISSASAITTMKSDSLPSLLVHCLRSFIKKVEKQKFGKKSNVPSDSKWGGFLCSSVSSEVFDFEEVVIFFVSHLATHIYYVNYLKDL